MPKRPILLDTTLRDGSYAIDFQFTTDDVASIAFSLECAGVTHIEVGHGLGLGAARAGLGDQPCSDAAYLDTARTVLARAKFGPLVIPGIAELDDLRRARDCGCDFVRIATNVTEAESGSRYVALAKELGLFIFFNLMKSYAVDARRFGEVARHAHATGADAVFLVDSAGGMLPDEVRAYVESARSACPAVLGFHGHNNLAMGVANTLAAFDAGARYLDTTLQGIGRSAGNAPTEVVAMVLQRQGLLDGVDTHGLLDFSEAFIRPMLGRAGHSALGVVSGRAKFHSSHLSGVLATAREFGVDPKALILALCARDKVGAPKQMVERIAQSLSQRPARPTHRVTPVADAEPAGVDFMAKVRRQANALREKSRKYRLPGVLNVVIGPYEHTHVSPFVETAFGCALSNIMLSDDAMLADIFSAADGVVDHLLIDPGPFPPPSTEPHATRVHRYSDEDMWARASANHVTQLLGGSLFHRKVGVAGVPVLVQRVAQKLLDAGAILVTHADPGFAANVASLDALVAFSPRAACVDADTAEAMRPGSLIFDAGIGSVSEAAQAAAAERGVRVVRVDMRPTLASVALEAIHLSGVVATGMGRAVWDGVPVVAGGQLGRAGEVVVDSIRNPRRVIGIADGVGGIRPASDSAESVRTVRGAIAQKLMTRYSEDQL